MKEPKSNIRKLIDIGGLIGKKVVVWMKPLMNY